MQWFEGSIPDAVKESRQNKNVFVVYIEGDNEDSVRMNTVWNDQKVFSQFSEDKCVAVKLKADSTQCKQFSQLYPVVCVPSVFFIGKDGYPLEVVGGTPSTQDFLSKATSAFEKHRTSVCASASEAENVADAESAVSAAQITQNQEQPSTNQGRSEEIGSVSQQEKEAKVERAKMLVEQRRKEKEEAENQESIKKETFRRQEGQDLAKAKRDLEERKAKELLNQIKEDRAKERAAREAVKQQIARDRAEREARKEAEKQERQRAQITGPLSDASSGGTTGPSSDVSSGGTTARNFSNVRLQFRLPDGSSVSQVFPSDALVEAARQFITSRAGANFTSVRLFTTYPKRELNDEDLMKSLTELGLVPSATIIVSPLGSSAISSSSGSSASDLLMWILTPVFVLISLIKSFLFSSPEHHRGVYGGNSTQPRPSSQTQSTATTTDPSVRRRKTENKAVASKEGNVYRLKHGGDDDDDNNTWNGNSTQQM